MAGRCHFSFEETHVHVTWVSFAGPLLALSANKTFAIEGGYLLLSGRCDDRTAQLSVR